MCFTVNLKRPETPSTHSDLHFTHSPTPLATPSLPPPTILSALKVCLEDVNQVFRKQKSRKASGPDAISPACLKVCADQLAPIFAQMFNRSLELCEVPCCFKCSTIIPVPKKPKITCHNDYRPVALMSVIMKSLEGLVLAYLKDITRPLLDPLQFAYRANRSVDDAVDVGLHYILQHLKDLICRLQLNLRYHHAWPSLRQTDTALCAHLHLSVDHQLPDRQAAASEAGQTHIQNSHHQTSEDYNGQSGLLRGLSVPLCPASKNFTPPEWGKGLRKSFWTPHTQLNLSLNCCPLAGATEHRAPKQ